MLRSAYDVTENVLTLRVPIECLPAQAGDALTRWLINHGINPDEVATDCPIERQPFECAVHWRVKAEGNLRRRIVYKPFPAGTWPAPFPSEVTTLAGPRQP